MDVTRTLRVGPEGTLVAHPERGRCDLAPFDAVEPVAQGERVRSIKRVG